MLKEKKQKQKAPDTRFADSHPYDILNQFADRLPQSAYHRLMRALIEGNQAVSSLEDTRALMEEKNKEVEVLKAQDKKNEEKIVDLWITRAVLALDLIATGTVRRPDIIARRMLRSAPKEFSWYSKEDTGA